jgi:hypothetical protein
MTSFNELKKYAINYNISEIDTAISICNDKERKAKLQTLMPEIRDGEETSVVEFIRRLRNFDPLDT